MIMDTMLCGYHKTIVRIWLILNLLALYLLFYFWSMSFESEGRKKEEDFISESELGQKGMGPSYAYEMSFN